MNSATIQLIGTLAATLVTLVTGLLTWRVSRSKSSLESRGQEFDQSQKRLSSCEERLDKLQGEMDALRGRYASLYEEDLKKGAACVACVPVVEAAAGGRVAEAPQVEAATRALRDAGILGLPRTAPAPAPA